MRDSRAHHNSISGSRYPGYDLCGSCSYYCGHAHANACVDPDVYSDANMDTNLNACGNVYACTNCYACSHPN